MKINLLFLKQALVSPMSHEEDFTHLPTYTRPPEDPTTEPPTPEFDLAEILEPYFETSVPCILLSIMTITLNTFVISYYRRSRLTFVPLLYTLISGVDILTGVGVIHQAVVISLFNKGVIQGRTLDYNAIICYTIIALSYKLSIYGNVVLAVSRTLVILRPLQTRIHIKVVVISAAIYGLIWIALSGYDIHKAFVVHKDFSKSIYYEYPVQGMELLWDVRENIAVENLLIVILLVVPYLLPVLVTMVTCIVQLIALHRPGMVNNASQRHVTVTIILMSGLFVLCNSAFSVFMLVLQFVILYNEGMDNYEFVFYTAIFGTLLPILNAALSPVIIISRCRELRDMFLRKIGISSKVDRELEDENSATNNVIDTQI